MAKEIKKCQFFDKNILNDTFSDRCRYNNTLFNKISENLEEYIKLNALTHYSGTIQLPVTCDDPWKVSKDIQTKLISSIKDIPCDIHMFTTCVDTTIEKNNELPIFESVSSMKKHITEIMSNRKYETTIPTKLDNIINYWQNLLFINRNKIDVYRNIISIINTYYDNKKVLGDSFFNKNSSEEENNNDDNNSLLFTENVVTNVTENYDKQPEYEQCNGSCSMFNNKECLKCIISNGPKSSKICKMCESSYLARYEDTCLACYINVEHIKQKKLSQPKYKSKINLITYKYENWINTSHKYSSLGIPCVHFTILKNQQMAKQSKTILTFLQNLLGNEYLINLHTSFNRSTCPSINAIMFSWKNMDYDFTTKLYNKDNKNNSWEPICRTFISQQGITLFNKLQIVLEEFKKHPIKYNPYMILETDGDITIEKKDIDWTKINSDIIHDYTPKINSIPVPIEQTKELRAVELIAEHMRKNKFRVNHDNTVWTHISSSKMTYKSMWKTVEDFVNDMSVLFRADESLVSSKEFVIHALNKPTTDIVLYSAIPRMKMSYRMIEFADGFLDINSMCIYKEQNNFPCYTYFPNVKLSTIYEEIETKFIEVSTWYNACSRSGLWYIEYLADLINQLVPTRFHNDVLFHVGDDWGNLSNYLIVPFLKLFPEHMHHEVRSNITQPHQKLYKDSLAPIMFPKSNMKTIEQSLDLSYGNLESVFKCGSIHNTDIMIVSENPNLKGHSYVTAGFDEETDSIMKGLPYILIYTALCYNARRKRHLRLYKLPVYDTITPAKHEKFSEACDYLYSITHTDVQYESDPDPIWINAFSKDTIAYKRYTCVRNDIIIPVDEVVNNNNTLVNNTVIPKKRGRKLKIPVGLIKDSNSPPAYEA